LDLGLVEGLGQSFRGEDVGEVDERADGRRDADAVGGRGFGVARAVDVDPLLPPVAPGAHVGRRAPAGEDLPERAG
jgi:hypothetical protein